MTPNPLVTLVTGASGALGAAVVQLLVERGHKVAATVRKGESSAFESIAAGAGNVTPFELDVLDFGAWSPALERMENELGATPSAAVLIAGAWAGGANVADPASESHWEAMSRANFDTARTTLRALLPAMIAQKSGRIVVVGSRAVERPWESAGAAAYAASKAALIALCQAIATEVQDSRVTINAVLPSTIDTKANRGAMPSADFSKWVAPTSLAEVIAFLISDAARDISGAAIPVYGRV